MEQLLSRMGEHSEHVNVVNPATGKISFELPQFTHGETLAAAMAARDVAAESGWASMQPRQRAQVLLNLHDLMIQHREHILDLIQFETGKSRGAAFEDFAGGLFAARHYGKKAPRLLRSRRMPTDAPLFVRNYLDYTPMGLVGVITPWNFPCALPCFDVLPALAAGNAVLHKVDNQVALTGLFLRDLAEQAGLPQGLWQVVAGSGPEAGNGVTDAVDYVAFTGSTTTGRLVAERAAARLIPCSLELGGKNPAIVLPGSDLKRAARIVVAGAVSNAGQVCVGLERCFIPNDQLDAFVAEIDSAVASLRYGKTSRFDTDMAGLVSENQFNRVTGMVNQARSQGFAVLRGEPRPEFGPFFVEPAIIVEPNDDADLHRAEVFGPVIQVYGYQTIDEAVVAANDTDFGLNASVIGPVPLAMSVARRLEAGSVNINDGFRASFGSMASPMGGVKRSGIGRRNGDNGLLRFTQPKAIGVASGVFKLPTSASQYRGIVPLLVTLSRILRRL